MIKNIVSVAAAVLSAGALMTGCNFDQPSSGCIVQDASFANWYAKYDLKEGENVSSDCQATVIKGETIGVFKFTDPEKAGSSILTIRPAGLYSRGALDPCDTATRALLLKNAEGNPAETARLTEQLNAECGTDADSKFAQTAHGALTDTTDERDFCSTSDWKAATVKPRTTGKVDPQYPPTTSIAYQFENVKVYSAPDAPGTQLTGDLTYTRDACTVHYSVRAIWPAVPCDPTSSNPVENCGEGSGINPDFAVECDATLKRCVPSKAIPSFKVDR
jgi:hypothetical protein